MFFPVSKVLVLSAVAGFVQAAPSYGYPETAVVQSLGADGGSGYSLDVVLDGSTTYTDNVLSVSTISSSIDVKASCFLKTVDSPAPVLASPPYAYNYYQVGPPQTITSISCTALQLHYKRNRPEALIEFVGAAHAGFGLAVPYDGSAYVIPKGQIYEIGVSEVNTNDVALEKYCKLDTVKPASLKELGAGKWQLSPPTPVKSITCSCDVYYGGCYH